MSHHDQNRREGKQSQEDRRRREYQGRDDRSDDPTQRFPGQGQQERQFGGQQGQRSGQQYKTRQERDEENRRDTEQR